jgi:hypothetical protein
MQMPSFLNCQNKRSLSCGNTPSSYPKNINLALSNVNPNNIEQLNSLTSSVDSLVNLRCNLKANNLLENNQKSLKNDLLKAADSVTNAMQNLLQELSLENEINKTSTSEDEDEDDNTVINNLEVLHDLDSKKIQSDIVVLNNSNTCVSKLQENDATASVSQIKLNQQSNNFDLKQKILYHKYF